MSTPGSEPTAPSSDDAALEKARARAVVLQARAERLPEPHEDAERAAALADLSIDATTIAAYIAFGTEPPLEPALSHWLARGVRVLLPVVLPDRDLEFRVYGGWLVTGRLGMACPPPSAELVPLAEASLVLVPALVCDRQGRRLGRGGGSYDRVLPRAAPDALTVGVVYPEELWATVPAQPHDQRVRAVLSGARLVRTDT